MIDNHLALQPETSRRAARVIQHMDFKTRAIFIHELENVTRVEDLPEPFRSLMGAETLTDTNPNIGNTEYVD